MLQQLGDQAHVAGPVLVSLAHRHVEVGIGGGVPLVELAGKDEQIGSASGPYYREVAIVGPVIQDGVDELTSIQRYNVRSEWP